MEYPQQKGSKEQESCKKHNLGKPLLVSLEPLWLQFLPFCCSGLGHEEEQLGKIPPCKFKAA